MMNKWLAYLLGPELLWVAFFLVCGWLRSWNVPPNPAGNALLEKACLHGMFLATALTFVVFAVPGCSRWWLLGRIFLAVLVGVNVCLFRLIDGIDYGDSRNSGVLGIWIYGCLLSTLALIPGTLATLLFWWRAAGRGAG